MWSTLIPIIAKYGVDFAELLWQKWATGANPTSADWADLRSLNQKTPHDFLAEALARAGIPVTDQRYVDLMAKLKETLS